MGGLAPKLVTMLMGGLAPKLVTISISIAGAQFTEISTGPKQI